MRGSAEGGGRFVNRPYDPAIKTPLPTIIPLRPLLNLFFVYKKERNA